MPDNPIPHDSFTFPLARNTITLGRDPSCHIPLKGIGASRFHATIHLDETGNAIIEDNGSTFGTRVDGMPARSTRLANGSVVTIGVNKFRVALDEKVFTISQVRDPEQAKEVASFGEDKEVITIGRDQSSTIRLSHPLVSRFHATARHHKGGRFTIEDHGSTNGTFVNGKAVHFSQLDDGDVLQIGPYRFFCDNATLQQAQDFNRIKIEAFNLTVRRGNSTLISDVSLSIEPGQFVAILGPSGAGKSTLAYALTGQIPVWSGSVFFNGLPMRKFCPAFNSSIGYVSQQNLLRQELTVFETFTEQSILRLPRDSMAAEHQERIREVTELLDLVSLKNRRISDLSGGEAKRVHFGIELLSSPTLIFLDEPLAGLDPGLTQKFMELFRTICDKGHTILLTTHTLEQIDLCNQVFFISTGRLVYSGTPAAMKNHFKASSLSDVYEKARALPPAEPEQARSDSAKSGEREFETGRSGSVNLYRPKTVSLLRQVSILLRRYCTILARDVRTLSLIMVQAPFIALLLAFVYKPDSTFLPLSFYFCISISVIWMGGMNSVREIAREWLLIEREFRIGLSKSAYIVSKLLVFCSLGMVQALVFGCCLHLLFAQFSFSFSNMLLLCAACGAGAVVGLCISVFSRNVNMAISFLPIIFIPQIFFSGILMPFDEMPVIGNAISYLTVSRPIYSMFKKLCFFNQSVAGFKEWYALSFLCIGLIILLFTGIRLRRIIRGGFINQ
jgi:ABC transport system ATP-binding/permease protein